MSQCKCGVAWDSMLYGKTCAVCNEQRPSETTKFPDPLIINFPKAQKEELKVSLLDCVQLLAAVRREEIYSEMEAIDIDQNASFDETLSILAKNHNRMYSEPLINGIGLSLHDLLQKLPSVITNELDDSSKKNIIGLKKRLISTEIENTLNEGMSGKIEEKLSSALTKLISKKINAMMAEHQAKEFDVSTPVTWDFKFSPLPIRPMKSVAITMDISSSTSSDYSQITYPSKFHEVEHGKRQSGRTVRMLVGAINASLAGNAVYILCTRDSIPYTRNLAHKICRTNGFVLPISIKFETIGSLGAPNINWHNKSLNGAHSNCQLFIDHNVYVEKFGHVLEGYHAYDGEKPKNLEEVKLNLPKERQMNTPIKNIDKWKDFF